ncbi:MAG: cadherin repeat domain-containing protein [Planctomycetaceae bacterium]
MSQSSFSQLDVPVRMRLVAGITSLLTVLTALTSPILAEDSADLSNRRVLVTCDLHENPPSGTLLARLLDHHLTLKNFRLAEPQNGLEFTVEPQDGSVCINHDAQIDFESQRILRLLVLADDDLAEQDPFLEEFSAGLLDDGLTADAFKSLSTRTVTFDITIRLRDVPEPPELGNANLMVQVFDDSETEFGTIAAINAHPGEGLQYFIASGDEDDVFQIHADTGTLSLREGAARHFDMNSTHELVILAENSAGLSATANVVITVFNETPQVAPVSGNGTAKVAEKNSAPEPADSESVSPIAANLPFELPFGWSVTPNHKMKFAVPSIGAQDDEGESTREGNARKNSTEHLAAADTDSDSGITQPVVPILNLDTIEMVEVGNWVASTDAAGNSDSKSAAVEVAKKTKPTRSRLPAPKARSASHGILPSLVALIVFLMSCVAAVVALSHASAARKAVLEEASFRNDETLAANALLLLEMESEHEVQSVPVTMLSHESDVATDQNSLIEQTGLREDVIAGSHSETQMNDDGASEHIPVVRNSPQHSAQISELKNQLATRDQLIAELTRELHAASRGSVKSTLSGADADGEIKDDSWDDYGPCAANDSQPVCNTTLLPKISERRESETDVRSSLMMARERLEREFSGDTRTPPALRDNNSLDMSLSYESTSSAVATLDESDQLRNELAELFEMQAVEEAAYALSSLRYNDSALAKSDVTEQESEDCTLIRSSVTFRNYLNDQKIQPQWRKFWSIAALPRANSAVRIGDHLPNRPQTG